MEMAPSSPPPSSSSPRDPRVQCRSRAWASQLLRDYRPFLEKLGAGQPLESEALEQAVAEALWKLVGTPSNADIKLLEDRLDELIVEVASKRNQYPREVQVQVVKALKAQQKLLDCYQTTVNLQEITPKPSQDLHMADLSLATKNASRHIGESFKSLSSLLEKAEGFSKALSLQPTLEQCKLHQEIVAGSEEKKENKIDVKNLTSQVEVTPPQTAISNSILLKLKRPSCSPRKHYPLRQKKITLDT
ncbi:hypothetical protein JD844_025251 [Phrynosoma platyrhinos]|uniref:NSL1 component of MIS12 kinetochore complex n=1 Tax=Phrynosoma platyrhinos TaxID=52577 RepID=A0ABQ7SZX7_PHRPL|nr:hypothetical protein JD844_025251 [Phrynosoma platyrhinos]